MADFDWKTDAVGMLYARIEGAWCAVHAHEEDGHRYKWSVTHPAGWQSRSAVGFCQTAAEAKYAAEDQARAWSERDALRSALRGLVDSFMRCDADGCGQPAAYAIETRAFCEQHAYTEYDEPFLYAAPLRTALALLARTGGDRG